jgi:hypothetical protein
VKTAKENAIKEVHTKKEPPQAQSKTSVEQVAQRMQVLQFNINKMQIEYNRLYDMWLTAMQKQNDKSVEE